MALADDLLDQSRILAGLSATRPRQANLRRAVSTAYYALFHLLIAEASARASSPTPAMLRSKVARAFTHADMKQACAQFTIPTPDHLVPLLHGLSYPSIRDVADAFISLQQARHEADYDLSATLTKAITLQRIAEASQAFVSFNAAMRYETDAASVFLAALAFNKGWRKT